MIRHFTATALVFNDDGDVLLIHHIGVGGWLPPGGHVDPNEDPAQAAVREVAEETGVVAGVVHDLPFRHPAVTSHPAPWAIIEMGVTDRRIGAHRHIDMLHVCRATTNVLDAHLAEVRDARWVPPAAVRDLATPEELPTLVESALRCYQRRVTAATDGRSPG